MEEKEFIQKYPKESIDIPIFFRIDTSGKVIIDSEGMQEEFNNKLIEVLMKVNPEFL